MYRILVTFTERAKSYEMLYADYDQACAVYEAVKQFGVEVAAPGRGLPWLYYPPSAIFSVELSMMKEAERA